MDSDSPVIEDRLVALRAGDADALGPLFAHYRDMLCRMVQLRLDPRLAGRVDADDIVQEAYLDAEQRLPHYMKDTSQSFLIWLRLVTGQTLIDVHRRHLGAKMRNADREWVSGRAGGASAVSISRHLLGHMTSPSHAAIRAEQAVQLEEALASMDDKDREVLVLRHFEELTNNEVAEILEMKKSAASNRYIRALARLKSLLVDHPDFRIP